MRNSLYDNIIGETMRILQVLQLLSDSDGGLLSEEIAVNLEITIGNSQTILYDMRSRKLVTRTEKQG